ncbi:hypothetical protein [Nocardia fluminea]|uniref:hypothetical protein n=1 Tax=Nocardia fluminea TaxID=134984 RepID=UPI00365B3FFB
MQITIKGTANTDTLELGEVRTVELTPFIKGLIRNGLAEQVPRPIAPKKYAEGGIIVRSTAVVTPEPERVLSSEEATAFVKVADEQEAKPRRRRAPKPTDEPPVDPDAPVRFDDVE